MLRGVARRDRRSPHRISNVSPADCRAGDGFLCKAWTVSLEGSVLLRCNARAFSRGVTGVTRQGKPSPRKRGTGFCETRRDNHPSCSVGETRDAPLSLRRERNPTERADRRERGVARRAPVQGARRAEVGFRVRRRVRGGRVRHGRAMSPFVFVQQVGEGFAEQALQAASLVDGEVFQLPVQVAVKVSGDDGGALAGPFWHLLRPRLFEGGGESLLRF